jgi:hypothetical protein
MRKTILVYCEQCGSEKLKCCDAWLVFERLTFCSPDCREDYRAAVSIEVRRPRRAQRVKASSIPALTK